MTSLDQILARSAERYPHRTAVEELPDRKITYWSLERLACRFRDSLAVHGIGAGDRIGLYSSKSIDAVIAIFGILKAGAAYVPVDPDAPPERNARILEDCQVRSIVVEPRFSVDLPSKLHGLSPLPGENGTSLLVFGNSGAKASPGKDLAYVLYTSGSTGDPKGVMITHRSALSFLDWCTEAFVPTELDRFSSHAPFHFDLSILDLFLSLRSGATVVLIDEKTGKLPAALASLIEERRISVWYSTPTVLRLLVRHGKVEEKDHASLRLVLFAGEVFPLKHLRALRSVWREPDLYNLYGPTETNVCTFFQIPRAIPPDREEPFPIGEACSHCDLEALDEKGRPVGRGEEGELVVGGPAVMEGYWNLPELTRQVLITDENGTRWYRTGDVVREAGEGIYEFIGRRDRMVKRRGYRVELGEIEAALYRHPDVLEVAVAAEPDDENGVLIKAHVVWEGREKPSLLGMKQFCMERLPPYMIPDRFSFKPSLPRTSTNKLDYRTLEMGP